MSEMKNGTVETPSIGITEMNIDLKCIDAAEMLLDEIKKEKPVNPEKAINEALAVLKENGLYALVIYLEANFDINKKCAYSLVSKQLTAFGDILFAWKGKCLREKAKNLAVTDNIFTLFFAIDTIEQMLIYARFLVKGLPKETPKPDAAQTAPAEKVSP